MKDPLSLSRLAAPRAVDPFGHAYASLYRHVITRSPLPQIPGSKPETARKRFIRGASRATDAPFLEQHSRRRGKRDVSVKERAGKIVRAVLAL